MALELELVLLEPADVEFLAGSAALELARDVLLVVADNPVGCESEKGHGAMLWRADKGLTL
jgi:hypothetical protein